MKTLAAIDSSGSAAGVLETARSLAALLATEDEAVHVCTLGDPTGGILKALDDDVVVAVIGTGGEGGDRPALGPVARTVMTSTSKPVVLVPPSAVPFDSTRPVKIVVPLDGSPATARGLRDVLDRLADRDAEIVAVHVFNATNAPRYWDHFYYDFPSWHERFRQDNCPLPSARLEVAQGSVAEEVLRVAEAERARLIAVAWFQVLAPGRAPVVTQLLRSARVPVLLVPVDTAAPSPEHLFRGQAA